MAKKKGKSPAKKSNLKKTFPKKAKGKASKAKKMPIKKAKTPPPKKSPPKKGSSKKAIVRRPPPKRTPPKKVPKKNIKTIKAKPTPIIKSSSSNLKSGKSNIKSSGKSPIATKNAIALSRAAQEAIADKKKRNYSEIDRDLLGIITEHQHLFIKDIEDTLHLTLDEVKKALKRLEQKGKIKTHQEMHEGKWLIEAEVIDNFGIDPTVKKKITTTEINWNKDDIPCYLCPNVKKCKAGQEELNPQKCKELTGWLDSRINKKDYTNPYKNQVKDIK
jgi:hypothetical protein